MTLESWNSLFQSTLAVVAGLAFLATFGALVTGNRINARQSERILALETTLASAKTALAEQQERAANAEKSLLELQRAIEPRRIDGGMLVGRLKGKTKAPAGVEILYKADDTEAYGVAIQLNRWLGPGTNGDGVGWRIVALRELEPSDAMGISPSNSPTTMRAGAVFGPTLLVRNLLPKAPFPHEINPDTPPVYPLIWALQESGFHAPAIGNHPRLPEGIIRIVIGQK